MMWPSLSAFAAASAFVGAALYINLVEQPARLALGPRRWFENGRPVIAAALSCWRRWR
jgi:hypothetical protein